MNDAPEVLGGSFRDPSGFVFRRQGRLLRHVAATYARHYDRLMASGLYAGLVEEGLLVAHEEVDVGLSPRPDAYKVLAPEELDLISYPYEWSFSAHKAAALATLDLQERAFDHGMTLKDATAYNLQFVDLRPRMIDTLSFEIHEEGSPWMAYKQFCEHFVVPLALMAKVDVRLGELFQQFVEGIPLEIGSKLLPWMSRFSPGLQMHVHMHAAAQRKHQGGGGASTTPAPKISENAHRGMLQSLRGLISGLTWSPAGTEWGDYYSFTNYSDSAASEKAVLVGEFLRVGLPENGRLLDLGGNTGLYSRLGLDAGARVISSDVDPAAVEKNHRMALGDGLRNYAALRLDLMRPGPALGWGLEEREGALERWRSDVVMALALIHHLCISNNVPMTHFAKVLRRLAPVAVVEFVPKSDSQVEILLSSRPDIFPTYDLPGFEAAVAGWFDIDLKVQIPGTERTLYLLRGR